MDSDQIKSAMNEMGFEMVDNGVMELPASTPAAFAFKEPATLDTDALERELGDMVSLCSML